VRRGIPNLIYLPSTLAECGVSSIADDKSNLMECAQAQPSIRWIAFLLPRLRPSRFSEFKKFAGHARWLVVTEELAGRDAEKF
jgi:hypothetical protein